MPTRELKQLSTPKWNWCSWLLAGTEGSYQLRNGIGAVGWLLAEVCKKRCNAKLLDLANPGLLSFLRPVISTIRLSFFFFFFLLSTAKILSAPGSAPPFSPFLDLGRQGNRPDHLHSGIGYVIGVFWRLSSRRLFSFRFLMEKIIQTVSPRAFSLSLASFSIVANFGKWIGER